MDSSQRSVGDLTRDLSEQTAVLVRKELALASAEMKEKAAHTGVGAGLFGGAALISLFGLATLIATAILALSEVLAPWLAALIVTVVLFAIGAIAALVGKREVDEGTPLKPEKASHEVNVDTETVKEAARRGFDREGAANGR
jgi:uncharacterized membrane protein YqjE